MRALTIWEPWAILIAVGAKRFETRAWTPGEVAGETIALHAGKRFTSEERSIAQTAPFARLLRAHGYGPTLGLRDLPLGAIVGVATLVHVYPTPLRDGSWVAYPSGTVIPPEEEDERALGDYSPGRFAWRFTDARVLPTPIPCRGYQGLWTVPPFVEAQVIDQLASEAARV